MKQVDFSTRKGYDENVNDTPTTVAIPNTKSTVKIRGIKPYTLECLTRLWLKRDMYVAEESSDVLKSMTEDPYFAVKEALLFVLNDYWKIRLVYPLKWRWWAKVKGYTDEQMLPIIIEGKKKLQLMAHWRVMAFSVDMRTDWMKMTSKEAEQYRAELLSESNHPLLKNILATEAQGDSSSD